MKQIDDTPLGESEIENHEQEIQELRARLWHTIALIEQLSVRVADLETQKVANESNQDDPEWY